QYRAHPYPFDVHDLPFVGRPGVDLQGPQKMEGPFDRGALSIGDPDLRGYLSDVVGGKLVQVHRHDLRPIDDPGLCLGGLSGVLAVRESTTTIRPALL